MVDHRNTTCFQIILSLSHPLSVNDSLLRAISIAYCYHLVPFYDALKDQSPIGFQQLSIFGALAQMDRLAWCLVLGLCIGLSGS